MASIMTLDELEEALADRIEALSSTPWQQEGAPTGEVWRESNTALTVALDSALESHLAFSVSVEDAPARDVGQESGGGVPVNATVAVVFLYRLRTHDQRADGRMAIKAARAVASAILKPSVLWGSALPITIYQPKTPEGEFLPVRLTFVCSIDVPLLDRT